MLSAGFFCPVIKSTRSNTTRRTSRHDQTIRIAPFTQYALSFTHYANYPVARCTAPKNSPRDFGRDARTARKGLVRVRIGPPDGSPVLKPATRVARPYRSRDTQ